MIRSYRSIVILVAGLALAVSGALLLGQTGGLTDLDRIAQAQDLLRPIRPHLTNKGQTNLSNILTRLDTLKGQLLPPPPEDCTNGIDDDWDGLIDSADPDCPAPTIPTLRLTCPADQTATGSGPTVVNFPPPAPSGGRQPYGPVVVQPPSGSLFPLGSTVVNATVTDAAGQTAACSFTVTVAAAPPPPGGVFDPATISYLGSWLVPTVSDGGTGTFDYSYGVMAYVPASDSIYMIGHAYGRKAMALSIPTPVKAPGISSLPRATAQTGWVNVSNAAQGHPMGMVLSPVDGRIYLSTSDDYTDANSTCSPINLSAPSIAAPMGVFSSNLSAPNPIGYWFFQAGTTVLHPYMSARYVAELPQVVADAYFGGRTLLAGRHRGWCSIDGPTIHVWSPVGASPPPNVGTIPVRTVLQYGTGAQAVQGFSPANDYQGAAYLSNASGETVAIFGVYDFDPAHTYYGYDNWKLNTECDALVPNPCTGPRGWRFASPHVAVLFYRLSDLAAVYAGTQGAAQPQPYARLDLTPYMKKAYPPTMNANDQWAEMPAVAIDRVKGLIYVSETHADGDRPVVAVFKF